MAKLVALKINNVTYPVYQASGAPVYPLIDVNDMFLVKDPTDTRQWLWFTERDFRETFKFILDPPLPENKFSPVVRLPNDE